MALTTTHYPVVESLSIVVSVPLSSKIPSILKNFDVLQIANYFLERGKNSQEKEKTTELQRAAALLHFTCNFDCEVTKLKIEKEKLSISIEFNSMEEVIKFCDTVADALASV